MDWKVVSCTPLAFADETGLEENFRTTEALTAHGDDISIWQLVSLLLVRTLRCSFHFAVIIQCNVRELLLDVAHDFALRCGCERISALCQDLHHILGEVTTCQVQAQDCMRQCIALVDGNCV